jgi:hypothetical protein
VRAFAEAAAADDDRPPARPRNLTPSELRFTPQPATRWFNPDVLVGSLVRVGLIKGFGSFLDKRELQANVDARADLDLAGRRELWFDYAADTGDGFNATYTVASLLARRQVDVEHDDRDLPPSPLDLRRGELLVLGGDAVYPSATTENYENRMAGPFRAALPWTREPHPQLFALPGNHDWYDGLTGFLRLFGQAHWLGGWQTRQRRSYFAVRLPHRWWLWGMDIQSEQYIDEPQLDFFRQVTEEHGRPGDKLILATPTPSWVKDIGRPGGNRNLAYVERKLLRPHGIDLRLNLAGDLHHYARYTSGEGSKARHKITAGGGGAFLHPTHDLPEELDLTVDVEAAAHGPPGGHTQGYRLVERFPDAGRSWRLAWQALLLPLRHPWFITVGAVFNVMLLWTNQFGIRSLDRQEEETQTFAESAQDSGWRDLSLGLIRNPLALFLVIVLAAALIGLADVPTRLREHRVRRWISRASLGLVHLLVQASAAIGVALLSIRLAGPVPTRFGFNAASSAIDALLGGIVSAFLLGAYFAVTNTVRRLRVHGNEAFSAARLNGHKSFLRLHIDRRGHLTVYALGIDRVPTEPVASSWKVNPDASDDPDDDPEKPWLVPDGPGPKVRLVDRIILG